jgi:hypothetical protein
MMNGHSWAVVAALLMWLGSALVCAASGAFLVGLHEVPWLMLLHLFGVPLAFVAWYRVSPEMRAAVSSIDPRFLVAVHAYRCIGAGFVALGYVGAVSPLFANVTGWGDTAVALPAPFIAWAMNSPRYSRRLVIAFSIVGLVDFSTAVASNLLTSPTALGVLRGDGADTTLMMVFPLGAIPAFGVGALALAHLLCLARIRGGWSPS